MKDDIWPNPLQYYLVGSPLPTVMTFTANLTSLKVLAHRRAATALTTALGRMAYSKADSAAAEGFNTGKAER